MKLETYNKKRHFERTREPQGRVRKTRKGHSFVVQKHAARRLHYDFRLELDGVLLSWAVPKGPSLSPKDRRLAVRTEDHPIDYRDFEGTIPKGEYGGGSVIVWDRGDWEPVGDPHAGLAKGHLEFDLRGDKLHGRWILVRTRAGKADKEQWLLIKRHDDFADGAGLVVDRPESVLTGRTIEEIADGAPEAKVPAFGTIEPQLATLVDDVPEGARWVHEIKYDGYRILAWLEGGEVRLASRNGIEWTDRFPEIAEALSHVRARTAIFDGEVAFVRRDGTTDFQSLQNAVSAKDRSRLVYFVFDLLHYDGVDLTKEPLEVRKDRLRTILAGEEPPLRLGDHVTGDGRTFYREACKMGLEGIICKRIDAPYRPGKRGPEWVKVKCQKRQEMVIAGFTAPKGSRSGLGALLLAVREGKDLRYAGKVGTGFSQQSLADLSKRLRAMVVDEPRVLGAPRMRDATWVRPELVCEVRFTEWTSDGMLRHPTFEGLREDKPAKSVVRERAAVTITHPERVIDPVSGLTKADLAGYTEAVADRFLPFARKRPLMLYRCPEGQEKRRSCFVQKHTGRGLGERIGRDHVGKEEVLFVTRPEEVLELVQFNVLEMHGWGSRMPRWDRPDWIVLDLDPDEGLPFARVVDAAQEIREALRAVGLTSFVKTTGGKGLHVVAPLAARYDWDAVSGFSEAFTRAFVAQSPDRYVATMSKAARRGKIFVDHFRNAKGATAILPWSPRARDGLTVATPLAWRDLAHVDPRELTIRTVPKLRRDPWKDLLGTKQSLPRLR